MTDSEVCDLIDALSGALTDAVDRIEALEKRVRSLENDTPQARQLQLEADLAAADLAASGYGPADDYLSFQCRDRYHERCPAGVACECECHFTEGEEG
jgi:hypothetical protein